MRQRNQVTKIHTNTIRQSDQETNIHTIKAKEKKTRKHKNRRQTFIQLDHEQRNYETSA